MIGGELGLAATVRHINVVREKPVALLARQKHQKTTVFHDWDAHLDPKYANPTFNGSNFGVEAHGFGNVQQVHNVHFGPGLKHGHLAPLTGRHPGQYRQPHRGVIKLGMDGMHRGEGLSHYLLHQDSRGGSAAPDTLTPLEGHHQLQGGISVQDTEDGRWVASLRGAHAGHQRPATIVNDTSTLNVLFSEEHLRILIGDVNSELMGRIQKAAALLAQIWELMDTDRDGLICYYDVKSLFTKWSGNLAQDAEKYIHDSEKNHDARINYTRFIEIFLPLSLSIPTEVIAANVHSRLNSGQEAEKSKGPVAGRRKTFLERGGLTGIEGQHLQMPHGAGHAGAVGSNAQKASLQRKKSYHVVPDLSVGANAKRGQGLQGHGFIAPTEEKRSSLPRTMQGNKRSSLESLQSTKGGSNPLPPRKESQTGNQALAAPTTSAPQTPNPRRKLFSSTQSDH